MLSVIEDPALHENLVRGGRALARIYTWDRCAAETAKVYREILVEGSQS
jgi:glycosyltransferase involved in cell wall biosynthesis